MHSRFIHVAATIALVLLAYHQGHYAQAEFPATQLPQPDPPFTGTVVETYQDSKPSYPQPVKAPKGAPNVLIILLDDVGFGMAGTFGGPVPTPNLEKLAENGLKFNRFHSLKCRRAFRFRDQRTA